MTIHEGSNSACIRMYEEETMYRLDSLHTSYSWSYRRIDLYIHTQGTRIDNVHAHNNRHAVAEHSRFGLHSYGCIILALREIVLVPCLGWLRML